MSTFVFGSRCAVVRMRDGSDVVVCGAVVRRRSIF